MALYLASCIDSGLAVAGMASSGSLAWSWALLMLSALLPSPVPEEGDQKRLLVTVWNRASETR